MSTTAISGRCSRYEKMLNKLTGGGKISVIILCSSAYYERRAA